MRDIDVEKSKFENHILNIKIKETSPVHWSKYWDCLREYKKDRRTHVIATQFKEMTKNLITNNDGFIQVPFNEAFILIEDKYHAISELGRVIDNDAHSLLFEKILTNKIDDDELQLIKFCKDRLVVLKNNIEEATTETLTTTLTTTKTTVALGKRKRNNEVDDENPKKYHKTNNTDNSPLSDLSFTLMNLMHDKSLDNQKTIRFLNKLSENEKSNLVSITNRLTLACSEKHTVSNDQSMEICTKPANNTEVQTPADDLKAAEMEIVEKEEAETTPVTTTPRVPSHLSFFNKQRQQPQCIKPMPTDLLSHKYFTRKSLKDKQQQDLHLASSKKLKT